MAALTAAQRREVALRALIVLPYAALLQILLSGLLVLMLPVITVEAVLFIGLTVAKGPLNLLGEVSPAAFLDPVLMPLLSLWFAGCVLGLTPLDRATTLTISFISLTAWFGLGFLAVAATIT